MTKTLCTSMAVAGMLAFAGCGGSSSSSSSSASTPLASTTSTAAASSSTTAAAGPANPALAQEVSACKAAIASETTIPASFKSRLNHICDIAGTGNEAAVKKATHDVCIEVIKAKLPASAQQAAETSCPAA